MANDAGAVPSSTSEKEDERRSSARHGYDCTQTIAPYDGENTPDPSAYLQVECRDISTNGVSFYFPTKPSFQSIAVLLKGTEEPLHLVAKVVNSRPIDSDERSQYLIGCQFTGRLPTPSAL